MSDESLSRWVAFGSELASRRDALSKKHGRRVTQKEIASKVGITEKQLSRLETAVSGTEYPTVVALADALEYTEQERPALFALAHMTYRETVEKAVRSDQSENATKEDIARMEARLMAEMQRLFRSQLLPDEDLKQYQKEQDAPPSKSTTAPSQDTAKATPTNRSPSVAHAKEHH